MRLWSLVLVVFALLVDHSAALGVSPLVWKYTPGETYTYQLSQTAVLTHIITSDSQSIAEVDQQLKFTWTVKETHEDGSATIALKITDLSMQLEGPGSQKVAYNLADEDPQGYAAMLWPMGKQLTESEVTVRMTPSGNVEIVDLPAELADAIQTVPKAKKYSAAGGLAAFSTLARLGGPLTLPEAGQTSWEATTKLEIPPWGEQQATYHYRLQEPQSAEQVTIDQQFELAATATAEANWELKLRESSGTILFDPRMGRPTATSLSYQADVVPVEKSTAAMHLELTQEFLEVVDESE
jgi:hypothetical protein